MVINKENIKIYRNKTSRNKNKISFELYYNENISKEDIIYMYSFFDNIYKYSVSREGIECKDEIQFSNILRNMTLYVNHKYNSSKKYLLFEFTFLNYKLDDVQNEIEYFIKNVFISRDKLISNISNTKSHVSTKMKSSFSFKDVDLLKSKLNFDSYDGEKDDIRFIDLENLQEIKNIDVEEVINNVLKSWDNVLSNISNIIVYEESNNDLTSKIVDEVLSNVKLNGENIIKTIDIEKYKDIENHKFNTKVSYSNRIITFKLSNSDIENELKSMYIVEILKDFYLNEIRLKHNLIYSPIVSTFNNNYEVIKTSHEVRPENIEKIVELENKFFNDFPKITTEKYRANLFESLKNQFMTLYENQDYRYFNQLYTTIFGKDASDDLSIYELYNILVNKIKELLSKDFSLEDVRLSSSYQILGDK